MKHSSWVVQIRARQIKDGERLPSLKKSINCHISATVFHLTAMPNLCTVFYLSYDIVSDIVRGIASRCQSVLRSVRGAVRRTFRD